MGGQTRPAKGSLLSGTCGKPSCKDKKGAAQTHQVGSRVCFHLGPRLQLSCCFFQEAFPDLA